MRPYPLPGGLLSTGGLSAGCCAITSAVIDDVQVVITAERDGSVREWAIDTGRERRVYELGSGPQNDVTTMAIDGDPVVIATGLDGARFWSAVSGAPRRYPPGSVATKLTAAYVLRMGDGHDALLLGDGVGAVEYWPNASMLAWRMLTGAGAFLPVWSLGGVTGPEGPMAVVCVDGRLQSINLLRGRIVHDIAIDGGNSFGMVSFRGAQGACVAVIVDTDVVVVDPARGTVETRWTTGSSPLRRISLMPSSRGALLATVSHDGAVNVWTPSGSRVAMIGLPGEGTALAPAANHAIVAGYVGGWAVLTLLG